MTSIASLCSGPAEWTGRADRSILGLLGEQVAYWALDRSTGEGSGSPRFRELVGEPGSRDDLVGLLERVHPEDRVWLAESIASGPSASGSRLRIRLRDGGEHRARVFGASRGEPGLAILVLEEADEPSGPAGIAAGLLTEIAGRQRAELALEDSRTIYRSLVENVPYAIFRKDPDGRYTFGNRRYCQLHAIAVEELVGKTDYDLYPPELARKYREDDRRTIERGEVLDLEEDHVDPANPGLRQFIHTVKCPIYDASGRAVGIQGMFANVTDRRRAEAELARQATHDPLTGLPNRALFQERLEARLSMASEPSGRLAVLLMDLDRFREINDTFGHHYGDRLLKGLGPRFEAVLEPGETVARIGGDEFGIILPGASRDRAVRVAERLLGSLAEPSVVGGHRFDVGASIGVALCPDHGSSRISLLQRAEVAMYAAKRAQCGHALYDSGQSSYSPERLALLADLRRALSGDQFLLHYQPKLDLASRATIGAEALIRWRHPRDGLVSPGVFIPLAEQTGLIRGIDLWAASTAMAACRGWPAGGRPPAVAVNLAAPGLQDPELVDQFARMIERSGLPASRLVVEVTESAMMADPARARLALEGLHAMGVAIAIDDFGTGYSSFAYLKDLPIDEVKIDQSFVRDMAARGANACIVRAVVDLGHNLGLRVTAEGVEDAETLEMLAELGCDYAQGYHIARPLPPAEFEAWLLQANAPG